MLHQGENKDKNKNKNKKTGHNEEKAHQQTSWPWRRIKLVLSAVKSLLIGSNVAVNNIYQPVEYSDCVFS